jgi:hypothetical protein
VGADNGLGRVCDDPGLSIKAMSHGGIREKDPGKWRGTGSQENRVCIPCVKPKKWNESEKIGAEVVPARCSGRRR